MFQGDMGAEQEQMTFGFCPSRCRSLSRTTPGPPATAS